MGRFSKSPNKPGVNRIFKNIVHDISPRKKVNRFSPGQSSPMATYGGDEYANTPRKSFNRSLYNSKK